MSKKKEKVSKFSKFCSRFLVLGVFMLVLLILLKGNADFRGFIYKNVFQNNLSFAKINEVYEKVFGSSLPFKEDAQTVSLNKIEYTKSENYKDGVKLFVSNDYALPILNDGIVIFAGVKEGYGNTVIVQEADDTEVWYGNLKDIKVSMYDYLKKGEILGESNGEFLYMVFTKNGEILDYKKYI